MAMRKSATSSSITVREVPPMDQFQEVIPEEIYSMMHTTPNKHCTLDLAPTWVIKQLADVMNMVNRSFNQGYFPNHRNRQSLVRGLKRRL